MKVPPAVVPEVPDGEGPVAGRHLAEMPPGAEAPVVVAGRAARGVVLFGEHARRAGRRGQDDAEVAPVAVVGGEIDFHALDDDARGSR